MGRATGAAITAAAPEARVVRAAAGAAGRRRKPPIPDPRVTHPGSEAARQRQAVEDVKAARAPEPDEPAAPADGATSSTAPAAPAPTSPGAGLSVPMPAAAATGGGFLLGIFGWALGLAYLRGGSPEVRRLLAAKFLNKV